MPLTAKYKIPETGRTSSGPGMKSGRLPSTPSPDIDIATITNTVLLTHKIGERVSLQLADGDALSTTVTRERERVHTVDDHYRMICAHGTVWWFGADVWWWFRPSETTPERHAHKAGHRASIAGEPRQAPRHYMDHADAWVSGWDDGAATIAEATAREAGT